MAKRIRTFTREFMDDNDYPYDLMDTEFVEERRWYSIWTGVFPFEDTYYQVSYAVDKSEYDDMDSWWDEDEITATEVVFLPVVRKVWVPVEA